MKSYKFYLVLFFVFITMENLCKAQYFDGDTVKFWSVTYNDWPPLQGSPQRLINAICKKAGNHCYVFLEDAAFASQNYIDSLVHKFDVHFYDSLKLRYGPVPNVFDNDSNVFILILNEPNWSGYFDPGQQMPDSVVNALWNRHSSEREIIYLSANYFNSNSGKTVAHEFGHMLHWQQDHSPDPIINPVRYWEETWVDEGFSTFAAIYLTENLNQHNVLDNNTFFGTNPDIPLIYFTDYNQVKLFMLYMYEHFGKWNYISTLISNQLNGINGIDSTLNGLGYAESFDDAFEQWVIANFIDDSVYAGGKYSYSHYKFPAPYISATYSTFPTSINNATLSPYGSDYIVFSSTIPKPIVINFNGQANSKFRLNFVLKNSTNNQIDSIIGLPLDSLNHASFSALGLGLVYDKVAMIVMNIDSTIDENNTVSYSYSVDNYSDKHESKKKSKIEVFPNPSKDKIYLFGLSDNTHSIVELIDYQSKIIFREKFILSATIDINSISQGIYLLKITNNGETFFHKIIKD